MKFNSNHNNKNKIIHYNFPTFDSKNQYQLPTSFFNFKIFIPQKINNIQINNKNHNKIVCNSILDSGSICNFISKNLVEKLNLKTKHTKNSINIKGISGTTIINKFTKIIFQFYIKIQNKLYLISFKEKFLITDKIPIDLLIGNTFMKKFQLHYNYNNNVIYTNMDYHQFKKSKIFNIISNSNYYQNLYEKCNTNQNFSNFINDKVEHNKNFSYFNNNYDVDDNNNKKFNNKNQNHNDLNKFSTIFNTSKNENYGSKKSLYYPNLYTKNSLKNFRSPLYYLKNTANSILKSSKISKIKNFKNNSKNKYFLALISHYKNKLSNNNNI